MTRALVLDTAKMMVCGHREQDYGSPEDNFQAIADLWNAYLGYYGETVKLEPTDVAMMMALLKIARIKTGTATEDSFVDLAGYAACGGEITTKKRAAVEEIKEKFTHEFGLSTDYIPDTDPRFNNPRSTDDESAKTSGIKYETSFA